MKSAGGKHLLYLELAKLLQAGFGIREACGVLLETRLPSSQAGLLRAVLANLDAGGTIADAFSGPLISSLEHTMIAAGERGGSLATAFQHLADYFGMLLLARRECLRALVYPLVILHLGIFIAVVPPALMKGSQSALEISGSLAVALAIAYLAGLAATLAIQALLSSATTRPAVDNFLHRIPLLGKTRQNLAMARFTKVYHSCLLAGMPMRETVRISIAAAQSARVTAAGKHLLKNATEGCSLGPAFVAQAAFPSAFSRSYTTGEEAGTLDTDMARWSQLFQSEAHSGIRSLAITIPKLLYFFILIFVGWKIVAFFNGYYSGLLEMVE